METLFWVVMCIFYSILPTASILRLLFASKHLSKRSQDGDCKRKHTPIYPGNISLPYLGNGVILVHLETGRGQKFESAMIFFIQSGRSTAKIIPEVDRVWLHEVGATRLHVTVVRKATMHY